MFHHWVGSCHLRSSNYAGLDQCCWMCYSHLPSNAPMKHVLRSEQQLSDKSNFNHPHHCCHPPHCFLQVNQSPWALVWVTQVSLAWVWAFWGPSSLPLSSSFHLPTPQQLSDAFIEVYEGYIHLFLITLMLSYYIFGITKTLWEQQMRNYLMDPLQFVPIWPAPPTFQLFLCHVLAVNQIPDGTDPNSIEHFSIESDFVNAVTLMIKKKRTHDATNLPVVSLDKVKNAASQNRRSSRTFRGSCYSQACVM